MPRRGGPEHSVRIREFWSFPTRDVLIERRRPVEHVVHHSHFFDVPA
jgi:hypothetical protein